MRKRPKTRSPNLISKISDFIFFTNQPLSVVNKKEFKEMIDTAAGQSVDCGSRDYYSYNQINSKYLECVGKIKKFLIAASTSGAGVVLSVDGSR